MITLRLGKRHNNIAETTALVDAILRNPKSCDTVWFSTLYGYPPFESHKEYAHELAQAAKIFKDAGIKVSLQISNTLGHGPRIKNQDCRGLVFEGSSAEAMSGPQGNSTPYCFCWNGEFFREYIKKSTQIYVQLIQPDVVWIDDDLRADCHGVGDREFGGPYDFGCYCDNCIAKFNKIYNTCYTRNELFNEIIYGDSIWRKRYIDFCREGIGNFAAFIAKSVADISPDTSMAHQFAHWGNYMADNNNHILNGFLSECKQSPQVRPCGGYYHDKEPLGQFTKAMGISLANSVLPNFVAERKAEVENLPNVAFGKSAWGTIKESTLYMAFGCTGLTYTIVQSDNEPLKRQERMLKYFSDVRPYWEKLSHISKTSLPAGLSIFHGEAPYLRKLKEGEKPFDWANIPYSKDIKLLITGIPVTHEQRKASAYLLHNEMIDGLTDNDIEFLLKKPVLTDAETLEKLFKKGHSDRFRLKLKQLAEPGSVYEKFTDAKTNKRITHKHFSEAYHFMIPMKKFSITPMDNSTQILGNCHHSITHENLGGATVIAETYSKDGKKMSSWVVSGYCIWSDVISESKRNQILDALDSIAPLPAKLLSAEQCVVIPSVDDSNKTVAVTLASASIGDTEELELLVRNPSGNKIQIKSCLCNDIDPIAITAENNSLYITLPPLKPYEIITVFFE